ncbi:hypothetical protein WJX84_011333 [Apatococcus fuscideae]|uniref:Malic enzyme n=1 Tax=Apatococcus fuscideae TaxID=2026836 RepID=A0AAW1T412_9CHLO
MASRILASTTESGPFLSLARSVPGLAFLSYPGCSTFASVASSGLSPYKPHEFESTNIVRKKGQDVLHDPLVNKGTAFGIAERERLALRGLLPARILSMEAQVNRIMEDYQYGRDYIDPVNVKDEGVTKEHVRKWNVLQQLQDRNETLFYNMLLNNFVDMAPIVYTPTVGWACLNYHKVYRRPRGMYFSSEDIGEMNAMVWHWPENEVDAIVVTDGSRILGLGDLGVNGLGIPIGKLDLYVAAAGFHPTRVLPVVIDVGTDNEALRSDPLYMGLNQPRMTGARYYEVIDEFVRAVMGRWPRSVLQFEDFNMANAHPLLHRYRDHHMVFNDDIQGTAATALAGLYGALAVQGKPVTALKEQRICVVGAGSAGMGVVQMIAQGMRKHGLSEEEAQARFWINDKDGLITSKRDPAATMDVVKPFARKVEEDVEGERLLDVVKRVKPTVLIGLAGVRGRLFTSDILKAMGETNEQPIIFAMSNPTSRAECTAEEAQKHTDGRAIFASGSPMADVEMNGRTLICSQANNLYMFPGVALGARLGATHHISDNMLMAAAEAIPTLVPKSDLDRGCVYPSLHRIRHISCRVAMAVITMAYEEGHLHNPRAVAALKQGDDALEDWVVDHQYVPEYRTLIELPQGVME